MGGCYLCAVLPVSLVSVILRGIVACGDDNTGNAAQCAECKGKLRCGAQGFKDIGFDAVCCQAACSLVCKFGGLVTGIKGNGNAFFLSSLFDNVVCQSLCCFSDGIHIHTVGACSDDAAQSAGSKFQFLIKTLFDFLLVIFDRQKLLFGCFVKIGIIQPEFILLFITHLPVLRLILLFIPFKNCM